MAQEGKSSYERSTFVIDADGTVVKIMRRVNPEITPTRCWPPSKLPNRAQRPRVSRMRMRGLEPPRGSWGFGVWWRIVAGSGLAILSLTPLDVVPGQVRGLSVD